MLSYELDEEHEDLRKSVAEFARDVVAPVIGELYDKGEFPYEIVAQMGRMGLFGLPVPEEYGGMGGDYFALCLALEELARVDSSVAITLEAGVGLGIMPIYRFGTEEQQRRWLPSLCAGETLAAFEAVSFAIAASFLNGSPASILAAACHQASRALWVRTSMSAILNCSAWNRPIGPPNAVLSLT